MRTPLDIIQHVCGNPMVCMSGIETPEELLAAIRGICLGFNDPEGNRCLGTFPAFLRSQFPQHGTQSWDNMLSQLCVGISVGDAGDFILDLLRKWKESLLASNAEIVHPVPITYSTDGNTFQLLETVLRNTSSYAPRLSTLRQVLVFLWGIEVSRYPPHGSSAELGDLNAYVTRHFRKPPALRMEVVLLDELKNYSLPDACTLIADLLKSWRESEQR
jgi:hypothetical protein